ncbi:DEAD/DEAH box helicase [archaeon]|nr:DEAD/DEAH box helicase [archaeon]MBT3450830.1 DEAD/DEAH box helicase [archaeon]MBT6868461.1 DEAD/DEAH box helicase [archaeon]MBT7193560.1 DEAD/DEAH box helicase [archaeon]MBT7381245.1 DEAD/DEAH box helicase [archaeon]
MNKFEKLGIEGPLLERIKEETFDTPTEVQEKSIPLILEGKDIIAGSATGSGKTLAFSAGIIQNSRKGRGIQAIVLTPTRELAEQVKDAMKHFSKYKQLMITAIYGGVSISPQMDLLRKTDVVVGTPGRVLDHLSRGTLDLSKVKVAVLDEADRMLDMGFIDDVNRILSQCADVRQTLLFSATIPYDLEKLAKKHMKNPINISVEAYVDKSKLIQNFYQVPNNMKFSLLVHLLKKETSSLVMVFCNTQRETDFVANNLGKNGINAIPIHGGLTQAKRSRTLEIFNSGKSYVLVCTDVAARGLHIDDVSHVYNYDLPTDSKQYIHRIGRTARAGKEGKAISLLSMRDHDNFNNVLRDKSLDIVEEPLPEFERVVARRHEGNRDNFGRGGPRRPQQRRGGHRRQRDRRYQ